MKRLLFALVLFFVLPGYALAANPGELTYSPSITSPYSFEIIDYSSAQTEKITGADFYAASFINLTGSIGLTLIALMSENIVLSALTVVVIITLALVFMFSVIANRKIDANISDMTTDIELNQSLADLTSDDERKEFLSKERAALEGGVKSWQERRIKYGGEGSGRSFAGEVNDFRRLNSGSSLKSGRDGSWEKSRKNRKVG